MSAEYYFFMLINGLSQGMLLFIVASGLSLVFGVLRQRTSLTASILAHFLYNFSAVLLAGI